MAGQRLSVIGIRPASGTSADGSIGPSGLHLRWAFPVELGFPEAGFRVYRRRHSRNRKSTCADLAALPKDHGLAPPAPFVGLTLDFDPRVTVTGTGAGYGQIDWPGAPSDAPFHLTVDFPEPVTTVEVRFGEPVLPLSSIVLRAYDEQGLMAEARGPDDIAPDGVRRRRVDGSAITRVSIPLGFRRLHAICHRTLSVDSVDGWGEPVAPLLLLSAPHTPAEAEVLIDARLGQGVHNRYVDDLPAARARYGRELPELLRWLHAVRTADPTLIQPPADPLAPPDPPHRRRAIPSHPPPSGVGPLRDIYPQSMLLLAALDPSIARLLSLYWVDEYGSDGAVSGRAYDYKVAADWPALTGELCGLLLDLGATVHDRPGLPEGSTVAGDVLDGVRWRGGEQLRRVALRWPRPDAGPPDPPTMPVLYDVWRARHADANITAAAAPSPPAGLPAGPPLPPPALTYAQRVYLTETAPALVPAAAWEGDEPRFIDPGVALGTYRYFVAPIDLFGQVGAPRVSGPVPVEDRLAPPPPVRLTAALEQPGYPWRTVEERARTAEPATLNLTFEYGAFQHRQAPDADHFDLYWRVGGLLETRVVQARLLNGAAGGIGAGIGLNPVQSTHLVEVLGAGGSNLTPFVGGILSTHVPLDGPPSVTRRRFRIVAADGNRLHLAPSPDAPADGAYSLVADPHSTATWTRLTTLAVRPPTSLVVSSVDPVHSVVARLVPAAPSSPSPLDRLPPGTRAVESPPPPASFEVLLDRTFLESDLFTGGTAETDTGATIDIIYSTAGLAYVDDDPVNVARTARIGLAQSVPEGAHLLLRGLEDGTVGLVRRVLVNRDIDALGLPVAGGEIGFRIGKAELGVARVVAPTDAGDAQALIVRFGLNVGPTALPSASSRLSYFAPYAINPLSLIVRAEGLPIPLTPPGALLVTIPSGEGSVAVNLALTTTDHAGNDGPLSVPAQAVAVRTPPAAPTAPGPCDALTAWEGATTPPDRDGRATVCVAWVDAGAAPGARYEVGRALDDGIISADRRNWLLGRRVQNAGTGAEHLAPAMAGRHLGARVGGVTQESTGLYRVALVDALGAPIALAAADAAALNGGRLVEGDRRFQITRAYDGPPPTVLVRPLGRPEPPRAGQPCDLDASPDYTAVRADPALLRALAAKPGNEEAFNLASGVPVAATTFRDEVPGAGRNAFYYRVRAVDPAENRSAWSPVSVPFWQTDTTPPSQPRGFAVRLEEGAALLSWGAPDAPDVVGHYVYRAEGADPSFHPARVAPRAVPRAATEPARPTILNRRVGLPTRAFVVPDPTAAVPTTPTSPATVPTPPGPPAVVPDLTDVRALAPRNGTLIGDAGVPTGPNLFVRTSDLTRLTGRVVHGVNSLVPDGTAVRVMIGDPTAPRTLTVRPGSGEPLTVRGGSVDLTFGLAVDAIVGLLPPVVAPEGAPLSAVALQNLLDGSNLLTISDPTLGLPTTDTAALTIHNLGMATPNGAAVVAVVRLADGTRVLLRHEPGTLEQLRVAGGRIRLDLDIPDGALVRLMAAGGAAALGELVDGTDLRLTEPSILLFEPGQRRVTGAALLNPLAPDGTPVAVTITATDVAIDRYDGDRSTRTWRDTGLRDGETYTYYLAAVRRVRSTMLPPDPAFGVPTVRSATVGPVSVFGLDRGARLVGMA